jgi:hypothetical protein
MPKTIYVWEAENSKQYATFRKVLPIFTKSVVYVAGTMELFKPDSTETRDMLLAALTYRGTNETY